MASSGYMKLCSPILGIAPFRLSSVQSPSSTIFLSSATAYTTVITRRHTQSIHTINPQNHVRTKRSLSRDHLKLPTRLEECISQSKKEYPVEHQLEPITQYWDNASIDDNKEEEEFQGQLMAERHYMIDEDESGNSYHEHVQATTNLERELNYLPEDEVFECFPIA
jgi:hypothetical protein